MHDLHIWAVDGIDHILTVHLTVNTDNDIIIKQNAKKLIHSHGIEHSTIEIETKGEPCELLDC